MWFQDFKTTFVCQKILQILLQRYSKNNKNVIVPFNLTGLFLKHNAKRLFAYFQKYKKIKDK